MALETLKIYEERDIVGHVRQHRARLSGRICRRSESTRWSARRAARASSARSNSSKDKATRKSFDPAAGVAAYVGAARPGARRASRACLGDNVNLCPPLIITEAEIADLMGRIKLALDDTLAWVEDGTAKHVQAGGA